MSYWFLRARAIGGGRPYLRVRVMIRRDRANSTLGSLTMTEVEWAELKAALAAADTSTVRFRCEGP